MAEKSQATATVDVGTAANGGKPSRVRGIASWVLVVIGSILVPIAVIAFWGQQTVTDAERYIDTVGPLAAEEAIKTAIIDRTTETLDTALEQNQAASQLLDALPPQAAQKLAAPIEAALTSLVDQVVTKIVYSNQFEELWVGINKKLQEELVAVLSGERSALDLNSAGEVVLDTSAVASAAQQELVARGLTFLDGKELPSQADQQIVLLRADELKQVQQIYALTVPLMRLLIPLVGLIFVGAVLLSRRRARTVVGIGIGVIIAMGLLAIALTYARTALNNAAPTTIAQNALNAFYLTLTRYLSTATATWITGGAILAMLGWFGGRSQPATKLRGSIRSSLQQSGSKLESAPLSAFCRDHWRAAFIGIAVFGLVLALLVDPLTPLLLIIFTLICLGLAALVVVAGAAGTGEPGAGGSAVSETSLGGSSAATAPTTSA